MHVTIATPMYGGQCSGDFTKSLINTISSLLNAGIDVSFIDLYNESLITRARDTLTHMFLNTDSEYLLFIDADQSFIPEDILAMLSFDKDIVGAPVPTKGINWERIRKAAVANKEDLKNFSSIYNINFLPNYFNSNSKINLAEPVEVLYIGTGMMLIKRDVFETLGNIVESYLYDGSPIIHNDIIPGQTKIKNFWKTNIVNDKLLSEDYNFCNMWRESGGKIYAYLLAKVSHIGNYSFSGSIFD